MESLKRLFKKPIQEIPMVHTFNHEFKIDLSEFYEFLKDIQTNMENMNKRLNSFCYLLQFGQADKPTVEILKAAVFIASSGLNLKSGLGSKFIVVRVACQLLSEN